MGVFVCLQYQWLEVNPSNTKEGLIWRWRYQTTRRSGFIEYMQWKYSKHLPLMIRLLSRLSNWPHNCTNNRRE